MADPRYRRVVVVCGAQMGKTDALLNVIGARLDDDPVAAIYVGPTRSFVESQLEPRLMSMVRSAPTLHRKLHAGKSGNLKTRKTIAGVTVRLAWAGSATELSSQAAGLALVDERDRMESDVAGEGDPVELLVARGSTFPDFTLVVTSTPTKGNVDTYTDQATGLDHWKVADPDDVESPTWRLWQEGSRHEWSWPCPDCGGYFVPRFKLLKWPADVGVAKAAREARLVCPHCGSMIEDSQKAQMNAAGKFVAPGEPEGDTASFWVSGLCSPWVTWAARVRGFLLAVRSGDPGRVQATINTGFGELYRTAPAEARQWESVAALRDGYRLGEVPEGVQVITCGVDVQQNRLVYAVRGWGPRFESWLLDYGSLYGETAGGRVWRDLAQLLDRDFAGHRIKMMLVDSGFQPADVYAFARAHPDRVRATKGQARQLRPIQAATIDITVRGRPVKNGLRLWHLDSNYLKGWLMQRLDWPADEPGGWHLPADVEADFCRQITAEQRVVKPSGAVTWLRVRKENHLLDCEALNVAAAMMLRVESLTDTPTAPKRQSVVRSRWLENSRL